MNDASLMCGLERVGDLAGDGDGLVERDWALRDQIRQGRSLDQLKNQGACVVSFFQAVDRGDVRVVQRREDFGLTLEPGEAVGI